MLCTSAADGEDRTLANNYVKVLLILKWLPFTRIMRHIVAKGTIPVDECTF